MPHPRRPARRWPLPIVLLFACAAAAALERSDFAWQWPLDAGTHDGLVALTLDAAVYPQLSRDDLRDLAAFNGAGEAIPLGPAAPPLQRAQALQPEAVAVPWFTLARSPEDGTGDAVALHIRRGADGRLQQLDATVQPGDAGAAQDLLLDLSALERPVHGLALELAEGAAPLDARVAVDGSEDLGRWQPLARELALVALESDGFRLERTRLSLPVTSLPYLRLRRTDAPGALPVQGVAAVPAPVEAGLVAPERAWLALPGRVAADPPAGSSAFEFASGGPYPVSAVDVHLADRNAIADVRVLSRGGEDAPWRERARFTAFRLHGDGEGVGNADATVPVVRDRHWRVEATPPQARAPELRLAWVPDRFLLLTQGEPPFVLAAGSARAERPDYPLTVALAELQAQRGAGWQPPQVRLGSGAPLAGDAALEAVREPLPLRQILLWTVLVGGALALVAMVLRLLRQPA